MDEVVEAPSGSMSDDVRRALEADIRHGRLPPGSALAVKDVADRFSISRTPAKEALLQLAASGLVIFQPRRGAVVVKLEPSEVFGMLEVIVILEAEAARLCARRMTEAHRTELRTVQQEASSAVERGDVGAYTLANLKLHELIYKGASNGCLHQSILTIRNRVATYRSITFERSGRMKSSHREHTAIVDAIVHGDEDAACEAMTAHISVGGTAQAELMLQMSRV